jgi:hypothetical protein
MPKTESGRLRDTSRYNEYFGPERFRGKDWYGGHKGTTNDNNYTFFAWKHLRFMVVGLEYASTEESINWANKLIAQHEDRRVIVVTHCYQKRSLVGETDGGGHKKVE